MPSSSPVATEEQLPEVLRERIPRTGVPDWWPTGASVRLRGSGLLLPEDAVERIGLIFKRYEGRLSHRTRPIRDALQHDSAAALGWAAYTGCLASKPKTRDAWGISCLQVLGNAETVQRLSRALPKLPSHHALRVVTVLAAMPVDEALILLAEVRTTDRRPRVRKEADQALAKVAKAEGLTTDQLVDRLVPTQPSAEQLQAAVDRLERAMVEQRRWPFASFRRWVADHPAVGPLARRLLWGAVADGSTQPCRLAEDGQLVDREGAALPEPTEVILVHPIHLDAASRSAWSAVLPEPPFPQLERRVFPPGTPEADAVFARLRAGQVLGRDVLALTRQGWTRERDEPGGTLRVEWERGDLYIVVTMDVGVSWRGRGADVAQTVQVQVVGKPEPLPYSEAVRTLDTVPVQASPG